MISLHAAFYNYDALEVAEDQVGHPKTMLIIPNYLGTFSLFASKYNKFEKIYIVNYRSTYTYVYLTIYLPTPPLSHTHSHFISFFSLSSYPYLFLK